ncbi:MAG TPA: hypothetical protein VFB99_09135 [Vicinamibacterales bacterium]|nr:hypothetical protein [Vicinamibacterales bacterium]
MKRLLLFVALVWLAPGLAAQVPLDSAALALRGHAALVALDRYLETWNSRDGALWATSLHLPHVRPGPGAFEMTRTPEEYAKGVDFEQTLKTGWHHSEWVAREVLQVGVDKVHATGTWRRYTAEDKPLAGSDITYIITRQDNRWGVQARFAAGVTGLEDAARSTSSAAALKAVTAFFDACNSHDLTRLVDAIHYPHVRVADGSIEISRTAADFRSGPEQGRLRTWFQTRLDSSRVVQVTATGANIVVAFSRLGRDGRVLSTDEGVFLAVVREGVWKIQARSTMGSSRSEGPQA